MKYNDLQLSRQKKSYRSGRGISAGRGKTAGRGTKGQGARKSGGVRPGFEGGQMPLYIRLPKLRGFKSHRPVSEVVYTDQLNELGKSLIDNHALAEAGLTTSAFVKVKLIFRGPLTSKKAVKLQAASAQAVAALQAASGSFETVDQLPRLKKASGTFEKVNHLGQPKKKVE